MYRAERKGREIECMKVRACLWLSFLHKKGRGTEAPRPKNAELPCRDAALTSLEKCKAGEAFLPKQNRTSPNEVLLNCVASKLYHETIGKATEECVSR